MITYLFKFQTNYEEAGILITTAKGLDYAKEIVFNQLGAWEINDVTIIDNKEEGVYTSVNFNISGKI